MPRWRCWLVLGLGLASACGSSEGGPTGPTEGALEVVTSTTGSNLDSDGYSLRIDDGTAQALASNGADTVASLSVGSHTVAVAGIASNCVLDGQNPRTIDIAAGSMTRL